MKEIIQNRTLNSKIFDISDEPEEGTHRLVTRINPLHYENNGALEDIDMNVKDNGVHACDYDIDLYTDKIGYYGTDPDGKQIELEFEEPYVTPVIDGNKVTYPDVSSGTDLEIVFLPGLISVNRVLKHEFAKKNGTFRIKREEGIKGKLINLGADAEGKKTKLAITESVTGVKDEIRCEQTWTGEVAVQDKLTRKQEWSSKAEDVKYPVKIDPTSTFVIAANADDGRGQGNFFSTPFNGTIDNAAGQFSVRRFAYLHAGTWLRFTGITIAQSSTINSATLKVYGCGNKFAGSLPIKFVADKASAPGNPTLYPQVTSPTSVTGAVTVTLPNPTPYYANTNVAAYQLVNVTVTSHVQALVNLYAYSSGEIVFYGNVPSEDAYPKFRYIYQRDTGTTKDAELVVDFSSGSSGWTGTVNGILNPAKVIQIAVANIANVNGVA